MNYYSEHFFKFRKSYFKLFGNKRVGNAFIFRPYMYFKFERERAEIVYSKIKELWKGKDIVIVEGISSRNGVGNTLFEYANSVKRIICPHKDAFNKVDLILNQFNKISKENIVLISLGPAAKFIGFELIKNYYRVLDIGHLDTDYEYFSKGLNKPQLLEGKHTAELTNNFDLDQFKFNYDKLYESQIIAKLY